MTNRMFAASFAGFAFACAPQESAHVNVEPLPTAPIAASASATTETPTPKPATHVTADGLEIQDLRVGTGAQALAGTTLVVHYVGTLVDGTEFASSRGRNAPFTFGFPGRVIKGWNEGIEGMRVGGLRRLIIPAALAYGDRGAPPKVPPAATLIFEIELLEVRATP